MMRGDGRIDNDDWHVELGHRRLSIIDVAGGANRWATNPARCLSRSMAKSTTPANYRLTLRKVATISHAVGYGVDRPSLRTALASTVCAAQWDVRIRDLGSDQTERSRSPAIAPGIKPLYYALLSDGGIAFASEFRPRCTSVRAARDRYGGLTSYFFSDYIAPPRHR